MLVPAAAQIRRVRRDPHSRGVIAKAAQNRSI
jgi:hypothetical protein